MKYSIPLKEIVGFLPYGLKCYAQGMCTADYYKIDEYQKPQEFEIVGLDLKYVSIYEEGRTVTEEMEYCDIIPHVRTLSDLTKEITHNGETFVPCIKISELFFDDLDIKRNKITGNVEIIMLTNDYVEEVDFFVGSEIIEILKEWHFDIYDWIKDGLAIDLNTL